MDKSMAAYGSVTLPGRVGSREEASLSQGVQNDAKEEDEKTVHGRVQSRNREAAEAKRSFDVEYCDGARDQRQVDRRMGRRR